MAANWRRNRIAQIQSALQHADAGLRSLVDEIETESGDSTVEDTGVPLDTTVPAGDIVIDGEPTIPVPAQAPAPGDVVVPATPATPEAPAETPASAEAVAPPEPDHRVLFRIFDTHKDFTRDYYPTADSVNTQLRLEGEPTATSAVIRRLFDVYLHERIEDGEIQPPVRTGAPASVSAAHAAREVNDDVLFAVFKKLKIPSELTREGTPRVEDVRERLPQGYDPPTKDQIVASWNRYPNRP